MLPERLTPAHPPPIHGVNHTTLVFVTMCTKDRRQLLARPEAVTLITQTWREMRYWLVGRYVVMPDHLHFFCAPGNYPPSSLRKWMQCWRNAVTRTWPWPDEKPIWQPDYWDTQMRRGMSYSSKWQYVRENPVRHKLVSRSDDWLWQGELVPIMWQDSR